MSAETRWLARLERGLGALAVRAFRRPAAALAIGVVLTAGAGMLAYDLPLAADLEKLLPSSFPSVRDLEPVKQRFGGIGYIVVVGMGAEPEKLRQFADDYAPKLSKLEGIRHVEYKRAARFLQDRALYYLELQDVEEIARRIKEYEKYERRKLNPLFVKLEDEEPPSLDFSDIEAKYGKRSDQRLAGGGEEYFLDPDKRMVVLLAKPNKIATDLGFSEKLVVTVENYFAKEDLSKYGKDFRVDYTGTFKYKVEQQRQIRRDINTASAIAFVVLLLYLAFHFRSALAVVLVLAPVACGLCWTYGIAALVFGSLNILTGFLGAILGGLGIEHGIHLLGRYEVLRLEGKSAEEATRETFLHTGGSALVSSLVAAVTFVAIAFSEFRAFREFGVIAAMGMVVVLAAYFLVLPAMLGLADRRGWKPGKRSVAVSGAGSELSRLIPKHAGTIAASVGLALGALIFLMPRISFNYDFHSLEDSSLPTFILDLETNRILGYSMEPVVILTPDADSERALVKELKKRKAEEGAKSTIDFIGALGELVPTFQEEKKKAFDAIASTLAKVKRENLGEERREGFDRLSRLVKVEPFTREDVPMSLRRQFEGYTGSEDKTGFVLIFPNFKLTDGEAVRDFAHTVRGVTLPGGKTFAAAGEAMVLADVLELIIRESPPILIAAIVLVIAAMWATLGSLRLALLCFSPTLVSLLGLIGLMTVVGLRFNYLNIMIVPVLIGTTVDAGVHLVQRLSEVRGQFGPVYAETGRAIVGGLLTSAVGFGALLWADHPGLNSIGQLANLGFAMNLVVMLLGFPAVILLLQRSRVGRVIEEAEPVADK
ncbi:MAG: MMPL family transporter [Myxococcales bacterium]|nr:MMPL family transporter [Myxococcales bacterium]